MKKPSLRVTFVIITVFTVAVGVLGAGIFLFGRMKQQIENQVEQDLIHHSRISALFVQNTLHTASTADAHPIARQLGDNDSPRVTIILEDGRVIGDSSLSPDETDALDNHGNRPEFTAALQSGIGVAHRYSTTRAFSMVYCAARFSNEHVSGVVRVSRPVREIGDAAAMLYGSLAFGAAVIIALVMILSWLTSSYFTSRLRAMVDYAHALLDGHRISPDGTSPPAELKGLKTSLQELANRLEEALNDLAQERDRFEAVLDGMSEAVIAVDGNNKVNVINSAALSLLDLGKAPAGRSLLEMVRIPQLSVLLDSLRPGEKREEEFEFTANAPRILLARISRQGSGTSVIVLTDVTDLRRLEKVRRDFVSNVSHELRTPISIVRANAETLADGAIEDRQMAPRFLASIISNAERLTRLVSDLLDLARIEEGSIELKAEPVNLMDAFRRVARSMDTAIQDKKHQLEISVDPELSVTGDMGAIDQVLFNLLDNAVKYTPEGGHITLRGCASDGGIAIEVQDTGPGIDFVHQARIFERFYRVDKGRSRDMGGTGLGLAIVKHLTTAMKGDVGVRPGKGSGSIFFIRLPAQRR